MCIKDIKGFLFAVYGGLVGAIISYDVAIKGNAFTGTTWILIVIFGFVLGVVIYLLNLLKKKKSGSNNGKTKKNKK